MASDDFTFDLSVDVESLIEEIKKYPEIWNIACEQHKDRRKKTAAWKEVCVALCANFKRKSENQQNHICQNYMNKWRNIRDQFLKTVRKRSMGTPVRPYIYTKYLSFLIPTDTLPVSKTAIKPEIEDEQEEEQEEDDEEEEQEQELDEDYTDIPSSAEDTCPEACLSPPAKRKRYSESNALNQAACSYSPVVPELDENRAFFESVLPLVQSFCMDQILEFRIGVLNLIKTIRWSDGNQLK